jgi:hypothetical protein
MDVYREENEGDREREREREVEGREVIVKKRDVE